MIQDISPSRLDNSFENYTLSTQDYLLFFDNEGWILSKIENGGLSFNTGIENHKAIYLFSVDDKRYFLSVDERNYLSDEYEFRSIRELRDICTGKELFAAFTAYHLWKWYNDNITAENVVKSLSMTLRKGRCTAVPVKSRFILALTLPLLSVLQMATVYLLHAINMDMLTMHLLPDLLR